MEYDELARLLPALERRIASSYATARREAPPSVRSYLDVNRDFTLRGGKRLRALLLLAGYHVATGRDPRRVLDAAAALEHFQSWMLIHDDIMDHAEERRGGVPVHRALERQHRAEARIGEAEDYGLGIGITLGDVEEPLTVEALLTVPVPGPARLAALAEYVRMTRLTAYGQLLDVRVGTVEPGAVAESDVLTVHRLKSAFYTVVSPLRIGARLGGARAATVDDLEAFGSDVGVAFQLRDDVLGAGFDAGAAGKSANDLVEGKRTLLVVRAWATGSDADRDALRRVLQHRTASPEEIAAAQQAIRRSGSLDYSERKIAALTQRALQRIDRSRAIRSSAKPLLREFARRLTQRRM